MERLNRRIQEASEKRARRGRLAALLGRAGEDLADQRKRLAELEAQLAKEQKDVERLEGLSLTALFHTVLSSKQEQLKKERQELLAAKLRHDECRSATAELEQQVEGIRREVDGLGDVEARYRELLVEKEALLKRDGGGAARRMLELADRIGKERSQLRELDEALACGRDVLRSLDQVIASLGSASSWGTWDLLGGGLITTAIKHSKIDAGRKAAEEAQRHMRRLRNELADVRLRSDVSIDIDGFSTFADFFFDGLIFDWIVQSKISRSLEGARNARRQAEHTLQSLQDLYLVTRKRLEELEEARRTAIAGA